MDVLCEACERPIIENQSEYNNYLATLRKKDEKNFYKIYTNIINNFDEVNKKLNDYFSAHNKNFGFYFINCEFLAEIDISFIAKIQTIYFYNTDNININRYLLYDIDCFK